MATLSGFKTTHSLRGTETVSTPPNGAQATVDRDLSRSWPAGSSSAQVGIVWTDDGTATSSATVIALDALASMAGGASQDLERLMYLAVENTGAAALLVGGGTTPVLPQITIPAGGHAAFSYCASAADGLDVTTNKNISIECATSTTYRITVAGRDVP